MKKVFLTLICLLSFACLTVKGIELPEVTDHEKVTIYVFRGHGCSHCYEALSYFNDVMDDYEDYVEVKAYETWENENNGTLFQKVAAELGDESTGVPYIVIGDSYHQAGFMSEEAETIIEAALEEYENKDYVDVVSKVIEKKDLEVKSESLKEACIAEGIINNGTEDPEEEENSNDALIIIGIFVLAVGGIVTLIACSRASKNKKEV